MLDIKKIDTLEQLNENLSVEQFVDFLHTHLERFGDSKEAITKSIDYAFSGDAGKGGFLLTAYLDGKLVGALVMNATGMDGYIPEYILVYVAVDGEIRGKGIGRQVVESALEHAGSDVALHVEYDNPAKRLYERLGFGTKYAEMRYTNGG